MSTPLRVGIAGLGTVGSAVVRRLASEGERLALRTGRPITVAAVSTRTRARAEGLPLGPARWVDDPALLAADAGIDLFVEVIGGDEGVARACVEAALRTGKTVVTANKALLARHGAALAALAERHGGSLAFEASVAGGIPVIKTLREGLAGNVVGRIEGILNGTCNYILTRMGEEKLDFGHCLAEAQRLGYAEADPSFDVDGHDTAHKLALLASLAFGVVPDVSGFTVEGIRDITPADLSAADELGYRIKLLGIASQVDGRVDGRVMPTMVPKASPLAQVSGVLNAVTLFGDAVGALTLVGPGAGGDATASAVVADIADAARGPMGLAFGQPAATLIAAAPLTADQQVSAYYLRLSLRDRPGSVAAVATRMAEQGISFESIVQRHPASVGNGNSDEAVAVVLVTYETVRGQLDKALDAVQADGTLLDRPQVIGLDRRT